MDLSSVRARRRKSLFRPWNSYLAKKNAHDTAILARKYDEHRRSAQEGHMPHISPLVRLTVKLIDTYEDINHAYYDHRANNAALAAAAEAEAAAAAGNVADYHQQAHYTYEQQQAPSHYHVSYSQHVHDHDPHDHYYSVENPHEHPMPEAEAPFEHYPYNQPLMQQEHYQRDYNMQAVPLQHQQLVEEPQIHPYNDPHQPYSASAQHLALDAHAHHHVQTYSQWSAAHSHVPVNQQAGPAPKKSTSPAAHGVAPVTAAQAAANTEPSSSPHSIQHHDDKFDYIVSRGEIFNNRYNIEQVIGRGSFGQVVRALDTRDNTHVAIKIIKNNSSYVEHALKEVRMTSYLNSIDRDDEHSIMRLRDKFIYRGHQCLVLELLACSLYDLLCDTSFHGVTLNLVRKFCKQILSCLSFLARPDINIAHCDLKPENVLLRHPQRSTIKVVDFGAAAHISDSMLFYVQSRFYRAPEVILGVPYTTQVDVWSLGCMLIELHTGRPVFAGKDEGDQMAIIVKRLGIPPAYMLENGKKTHQFFELDTEQDPPQWRLRPPLAAECATQEPPNLNSVHAFVDHYSNGRRKRASGGHSEEDYDVFLKLALKMLEYDPEKRITAAKAMKDPFVCGVSTRPGSSSGRESPPPMPNGLPSVNKTGSHASVDPGRKAPHQRIRDAAAAAAAAATTTTTITPAAAATAVSSNGTVGSSTAGSSSTNGGPLSVKSVSQMLHEINLDQGTDVKSTATEMDSGNSATATTTAKPIATHAVVSAANTASTLNTTTSLSDITSQANFVSDNQATNPSSLTATVLAAANDSSAVASREDVAYVTSNSDSETVSSSAIDTTAATSSRSTRRVMIDPGCSSDGGDGNRDRNGERISHEQSREGNKDDIGGRLRTSKSEPAIESLAPKRTFVFARSDWAEEVGIEPPPWRSGAPLDMDADPASPRWGAGSGTKQLKRRPRSSQKVGTNCGFGHGGTCIGLSSIRNCPARQRFPHRYDQYQSNRWNWRNRSDFSPKPSFVPSYIMPDHGVGCTAILQEPQKPELLPFGHGDALRLRTDLRTGLH